MKFRSTVLASSLVVAALAFAAQASAACTYPKAPDKIPDGSKATKEEMLAGVRPCGLTTTSSSSTPTA